MSFLENLAVDVFIVITDTFTVDQRGLSAGAVTEANSVNRAYPLHKKNVSSHRLLQNKKRLELTFLRATVAFLSGWLVN